MLFVTIHVASQDTVYLGFSAASLASQQPSLAAIGISEDCCVLVFQTAAVVPASSIVNGFSKRSLWTNTVLCLSAGCGKTQGIWSKVLDAECHPASLLARSQRLQPRQ